MIRTLASMLLLLLVPIVVSAQTERGAEFGKKEFASFHRILRPLQHDALPRNDFNAVRTQADTLASLGAVIVDLGVPKGLPDSVYANILPRFDVALREFRAGGKNLADDELRAAFVRVHDTYEELVDALPQ